jgi:hypothetical protein
VRWQQLFADLEAQLDEAESAEFTGEVRERTRRELGEIRLVDRLRPSVGRPLSVRLPGSPGWAGESVTGTLSSVGADWLLLAEGAGRDALVPLRAVLAVTGLGPDTAVPCSEGPVEARLDFGHALRGVTRDRSAVLLGLFDGSALAGTLDRVGADFLELAEHPAGEPRRRDAVRGVRTVPLAAVAILRSS